SAQEQNVVAGGGGSGAYFPSYCSLAVAAPIYFTRFPAAHPRTGCAYWADHKLPSRPAGTHAVCFSPCDCGSVFLFLTRAPTVSPTGLYVRRTPPVICAREGTRVLSGGS